MGNESRTSRSYKTSAKSRVAEFLDEAAEADHKKRCRDCRHYYRGSDGYYLGPERCLNPAFFHPIEDDGVPLEYARMESTKCGPQGKLWEPIPKKEKPPNIFSKFFGMLG